MRSRGSRMGPLRANDLRKLRLGDLHENVIPP